MLPTISVIVVSHETRALLQECLHALEADGYAGEVETWVVDSGSRDGSAALVRQQFPRVHLIESEENLGFSRACNLGLARCGGELMLLLNADAIVRPGCLTALATRLHGAAPSVGLAGPALFNPDGSRQPSWGALPSVTQELLCQSYLFKAVAVEYPVGRTVHPRLQARYATAHAVDWLTGAALMLRRSVYAAIGGLPEHGFLYGEDLELCVRAREAGFACVYEPAAEVKHYLGASARTDYASWIRHYTAATLGYYARFGSPGARRAAALTVLAGSAYRGALWGALGLAQPARRAEAVARGQGYRMAAGLAARALLESRGAASDIRHRR